MDLVWQTEFGLRHSDCLARSYRHFTGRELALDARPDDTRSLARRIYEDTAIIVSHGTEPDPILNYANAAALALWEMSWAEARVAARRVRVCEAFMVAVE